MEAKFKAFGHAVHPMLIAFPLGLLATSLVFDIITRVTADSSFGLVAYWMIAAGVIGGLVAAVPGLIDWSSIPRGTRAHSVGLLHAGVNLLALVLFAISWSMRRNLPLHVPDDIALALSVAGVLVAALGGWLGGELVERLGMSVHAGANLNAPNSLSGPVDRAR